jgi:hypothetical protein
MSQLTNATKFTKAVTVTAGAAGSTDISGTIIDTQAFGGVAFLVQLAAIAAGAVTSLKVQEGHESDLSDAADVEGLTLAVADTDDESIKVLDYHRPAKRYARLYVDRATANATLSAIAVLYSSREQVVAQPAETATALANG